MSCEIGDRGVIDVEVECRKWGNDLPPDGTEIEVVGFGEIAYGRTHNHGSKPGIHNNRSWPKIKFADRKIICVSICHLRMEIKRPYHFGKENDFLRDLPETLFWETDKVIWYRRPEVRMFTVERVEYLNISATRDDGSPWPFYEIGWPGGGTSFAKDNELELIERGNVWKHYHNEPITFESLEDETKFHHQIGQTEEVKNPWTGNYSWDLGSILRAIREEIADGMVTSGGFFGLEPKPHAIRLKDRNLAKRVREATLKGFGLT